MTSDVPPSPSPYELAEQAARALAELTGVERHDIALVLGSGWLPAVDALGEATAEIATTGRISEREGEAGCVIEGSGGSIRSLGIGRSFVNRNIFKDCLQDLQERPCP